MSESVTKAPEEVTEDSLEEKRAMLAEMRAGIVAAEAKVAEAQATAARQIESDQLDRELEFQAQRLREARDAAKSVGVSEEELSSAVTERIEADKKQDEAVEEQLADQAAETDETPAPEGETPPTDTPPVTDKVTPPVVKTTNGKKG